MKGSASHEAGCLFCRQHDGGFKSREHIFSEAYGNQDKILEPGVVCDRCNNGPLSRADHALANFPPIQMLRAERGLATKAGKPVEAVFGNARVAFEARGQMSVVPHQKRMLRNMPKLPDGRIGPQGGTMPLTSPHPTARTKRNMTRAIWKAALEFIYLDHGPEVAFSVEFDGARAAVISEGKERGWMAFPLDSAMHNEISLSYWYPWLIDGRNACFVIMDIFGVRFMTDLLRRDVTPSADLAPEPVNIWTF